MMVAPLMARIVSMMDNSSLLLNLPEARTLTVPLTLGSIL